MVEQRDVWLVYGSDTAGFGRAWQLKAVVLAAAVLVWWLDAAEYEDSMSVVIYWRKFKWRDECG